MKQQEMFAEPNEFRDEALDFIRRSVLRGDNIRSTFMGRGGPGCLTVQIGGYANEPSGTLRRIRPGEIAVWSESELRIFSLSDLTSSII